MFTVIYFFCSAEHRLSAVGPQVLLLVMYRPQGARRWWWLLW